MEHDSDPAAFLRARLDEDEAQARQAQATLSGVTERGEHGWLLPSAWARYRDTASASGALPYLLAHPPARALREIEAKRAILALLAQVRDPHDDEQVWYQQAIGDVLRRLALPYDAHPDYRPEWAA